MVGRRSPAPGTGKPGRPMGCNVWMADTTVAGGTNTGVTVAGAPGVTDGVTGVFVRVTVGVEGVIVGALVTVGAVVTVA